MLVFSIMRIDIGNVIKLAERTGRQVLRKLQAKDFQVEQKKDGTPVTTLDIEAADLIREGLHQITPSIPVITEEDKDSINVVNAKLSQPIKWFVDPIDGTRTAIDYAQGKPNHDGWGIHIGLVENNKPEKGVVYFPARSEGTIYFTGNDGKAYKKVGDDIPKQISVKSLPEQGAIDVSLGWQKNEHPEQIGGREYNPICSVGGERVCLVADGTSHIGWLNGPFAPWDIAASHAVLRAANGEIVTSEHDGQDLDYSDEKLVLKPGVAGALDSLIRLGYCSNKQLCDQA